MDRQSELIWNACQLEYLNAVLALGDTAALLAALAAVARAKGLLREAESAGLGRLGLYKCLSGSGNPGFATVVGVAAELGYSFSMHAVQARHPQRDTVAASDATSTPLTSASSRPGSASISTAYQPGVTAGAPSIAAGDQPCTAGFCFQAPISSTA